MPTGDERISARQSSSLLVGYDPMSWAKMYVVKHSGLLSLCCGHIRQSLSRDIVQRVDMWAWMHCMRLADWGIARLAFPHREIAEEIGHANACDTVSDAASADKEATTLDCVVSADASFGDCAAWIGKPGRSACDSNGNLTRKYVLRSHLLLDLVKRCPRRFGYSASHGRDLSTVRLNFNIFHIVLVLRPLSCMFQKGS